ncbi:MAG TPA: PAS domain-containing sensor histidine kinase [Myxococcaceae bacterium]|nr:PAS domain-containing sensor histidine kinase [Myxococcaceae bacterium]
MSHAKSHREALERAWAAEERARLMIDSIGDYAIFMLDPGGVIQSWNPGAQRIKGYLPEEIIGEHFSRFYLPDEAHSGKCERELEVASQQGRYEEEGWRVRKDGTVFWANVVISAMRDPAGGLLGYVKVTRDLTERMQAEERLRASEERFRLLTESVKDYAIFMVDPAGRVATWNAGAERIKQYRADEILGQHLSRFYPPEDVAAGKAERTLATAAREGRFEDEDWRVRKDGTRFWANVVVTAIRAGNGKLLGFTKVTRDLTQRREAEQDRLRLAQAQEAVRLRDEFLTIASHELKTPLTSLQLQLQSLGHRVAAVDGKLGQRVERATRSCERLTELIDRLLDVSRISSGSVSLQLEQVSLSDLVTQVVDRHHEQAANAGCELIARITPGLDGASDRLLLDQAVANLLSNALKYAAGTPVEVSLTREGDLARLEVADRGPGVPEEALSRIFERFERAASLKHYGGLGLGLYIARELVLAHGGTVEARNRPGGGAVFIVRLPLGKDPKNG